MNLRSFQMRSALIIACGLLFASPVFARPSIGLLLKYRGGEFWDALERGAREAAEEANVNLVVKGVPHASNYNAQLKFLEVFENTKIDAFVITPANPEQLAAPLAALAAKGRKIVVAETQLAGNTTLPFVGMDQTKLSLAAVTAFAAAVQDGDEVALFRSTLSDYILQQREALILAKLRELRPNLRLRLNVFSVETDTGTAGDKGEMLLQQYPNCKLFIAISSASTDRLVEAAKNLKLEGKARIGGFGCVLNETRTADITNGTVLVYVAQAAKDIGYKSVMAAVALTKGEKVPLVTNIDHFIITKDNVNDPKRAITFRALLVD